MLVTGHDRVGLGGARQRDEVLVAWIAGYARRLGWIIECDGSRGQRFDICADLVDGRVYAELRPQQDVLQLIQEFGRNDGVELALAPRIEKFCRSTGRADNRGNQNARVEHDP